LLHDIKINFNQSEFDQVWKEFAEEKVSIKEFISKAKEIK